MQIIIALYLFNYLYRYLNANNYIPVSLSIIFTVSYLDVNNYSPVSLQ